MDKHDLEPGEIWEKRPFVGTVAEITSRVELAVKQPPEEVVVPSITLKGNAAARYHLISELLNSSLGMDSEEILFYLVRSGSEREITRLLLLWKERQAN